MSAPCRGVLDEAERQVSETGHENDGFLSWTRGFIPKLAPLEKLDRAFAAWDQIAAELPELHRSLELRRRVEQLPVLDASTASLDDRQVLRAVSLLAMLAQAYWYVELQPPECLHDAIRLPWAQLRQRLGREHETLSYIDLIVYNWRIVDPSLAEPLVVENLRLLLPTVGNREEEVFYLTQLEILARTSPVVGLSALCQEAVLADDPEGLEQALLGIGTCLHEIVRVSLPKINPNPFGATHVNPVVWAKTVAPFAVPMRAGDQGPSGTSSPVFNTLDVVFGRRQYGSFLGREIHQLRSTYPLHWRKFLEALSQVSISDYVEKSGNKALRGAWRETFEAYAGPSGFLGRHRMKVYGYLELAFKVGRSVTIGGFDGVFKDRTWDQVDNELVASQRERWNGLPNQRREAQICSAERETAPVKSEVRLVTLDVSDAGVRYNVGDRCAIFPENAPELIERTLVALGARGDELVGLTDEWKAAAEVRRELAGKSQTTLREVLRFGCIRPVTPRVAEALHAQTQSRALFEQLERGTTERWELWELLELLSREGFDPVELWTEPGANASEKLCQLLPPERSRLYSISSASTSPEGKPAETIALTVGRLRYSGATTSRAPEPPPVQPGLGCPFHASAPVCTGENVREGTASSFLARAEDTRTPIPFHIEHPARFQLPEDPRTPIIFFAGGTGISPFRAFLQERLRTPGAGRSWLIWSVRDAQAFASADELLPALRCGSLDLNVCFTRDNLRVEWNAETGFSMQPAPPTRIDQLLRDPDVRAKLGRLIGVPGKSDAGASLYVCGKSGFARSILDSLEVVFAGLAEGNREAREQAGKHALCQLMGNNRMFMEIHTDAPPAEQVARRIDISEVAEHNDRAQGHWMILDGTVYDLTRFIGLHPGGDRVIEAYAGLDGSHGYARAHRDRPEVDAMREMYRLGSVRQLEFDEYTTEVMGPSGPYRVSCRTAHTAWVRALHLVIEMQNALRLDHSLENSVTTSAEAAHERGPYKLSRAAETHYRFLRYYKRVLEAETLPNVWRISGALFAPEMPADWMDGVLSALRHSSAVREMYALATDLYQNFQKFAGKPEQLGQILDSFRDADTRLLCDLKQLLSDGVRVFERHGRRTRSCGAEELRQICLAIPPMLAESAAQLRFDVRQCLEGRAAGTGSGVMSDLPPRPTQRLYSSVHWIMEQQPAQKLVLLERTPVPWTQLEQLVEENIHILVCLNGLEPDLGLLVDMRQAPIRNDSSFENAMAALREGLHQHFQRVAVLLDSSLGELQASRIERDERNVALVTRSESNARSFLLGGK